MSGDIISGTPNTAATYNFTVRVTDAASQFDDQALSITINTNSIPSITTISLPGGTVGVAYNQSVASTGGDGALLWSVLSGTLPPGLAPSNLNSQNMTISGTPTTTVGSPFSFTLKLEDVHADSDTQALSIAITGGDTMPPTVSITAPSNGATISGTSVAVSATASDDVGVVGVQFKLDGANLGAEDTISPYSITWNTTTTTNGAHSLTAVARDAAGNTTTSSPATSVTVGNLPAAPSGLTATDVAYNQINLAWTDNASTETGFKIERKKGAGGTYAQIGTAAANATSYNDTTAGTGTNYYYRVRANNTYGDSAFSNEANDTTPEVTGRSGHWKFDENSGTTPQDSSGNLNHGTMSPAPAWTTGKIGSALNFDGVDDVVNCGSGATLDQLPAITVAAWINVASMGEGGFGRLVQKGNGGNPTAGWRLVTQGTNQIEFSVDYATTDVSRKTVANAITLSAWKHVLVTWTGSTTATNIHIYIDGAEVTYALTTNGAGTRGTDSATNLRIGNNDLGANTVNGKIDDVRVYNRVLTAAEITAVHRAGL